MMKIHKKILLLSVALLVGTGILQANEQKKIRVACVGNSVTFGYLLPEREVNAYPAQLQRLLGEDYEVGNFGHSGATLLRRGHRPYDRLPEFRKALDFKADLVVIHLGLNDTDPRNWPEHGDDFIGDYRALIDSFRVANPEAHIWICRMTPIFHQHRRFQSGTRDWHALIQQRIEQVARTAGVGLIDLHTPLYHRPDLFPDALHPNTEGAAILAQTVYGALTGNYGGLTLPATYGDHMVLQREQPITIAGRANAGAKVKVKLAGKQQKTKAADDGSWQVVFPARPAGGPYELTIAADDEKRTFTDVWVGEVWLCSGQSNMEWTLRKCATAAEDLRVADTLSRIHLFNMPTLRTTYAVEWEAEVLDSINRLLYLPTKGWQMCSTQNAADFSAIGYHFGRMLADSLGCHVGLICNAVGGSNTESWIDRRTLEYEYPAILHDWTKNDHLQPWVRERGALNIKRGNNPLQRHPYEPCYLFECGIRPLQHYGIRGVIWYQGESNAHNVELHERLFTLMEGSWRKFFDNEQLPFHFVQLSSIGPRRSWPHFRDSQRLLARHLPNTWMAVSSDKGDSLDVHPRAKREIGERLATSALHHTYGRKHVTPSGPDYCCAQRVGSTLQLHFNYAEGMQASDGGRIIGFEVAGADGVYHPAEARVEGDVLIVQSREEKHPCAVRYGWQPFTRANLVNKQGLPASTFRDEQVEEAAKH